MIPFSPGPTLQPKQEAVPSFSIGSLKAGETLSMKTMSGIEYRIICTPGNPPYLVDMRENVGKEGSEVDQLKGEYLDANFDPSVTIGSPFTFDVTTTDNIASFEIIKAETEAEIV